MKNKIFLVLLVLIVGVFFSFGCATMRLEDGVHSNRAQNGALIGAVLGSVPGILMEKKEIGVAGALAGGAVGAMIGGVADRRAYANSRVYREDMRQEWKDTYRTLVANRSGGGRGNAPTVIVTSGRRGCGYCRDDWRGSAFLATEQGMRQRGFVIPYQDEERHHRHYRGYSARDADFMLDLQVLDLGSSIKVTATLRSLTGDNQLDRQGVGQARYGNERSRTFSTTWDSRQRGSYNSGENKEKAATTAAKRAILNLFENRYENTLEATG